MIHRCCHTIFLGWALVLLMVGVTPHAALAAAREGLDCWFTCGIVFWGPCEPEVENEESQASRTEESSKGLSREVLQTSCRRGRWQVSLGLLAPRALLRVCDGSAMSDITRTIGGMHETSRSIR